MATPIQKHLGVMGSNPKTGECFAAFMDAPKGADLRFLLQIGAILEKAELESIKDAFCVSHASRQIRLYGPSIGRYMGQDIPEWHERADGRRYHYSGVCGLHPDFKSLAHGQVVVGPGLIYQLASGPL